MKPYFPSYVRIEWARFPDGEVLRRELGDAGFEDARIITWASSAASLATKH